MVPAVRQITGGGPTIRYMLEKDRTALLERKRRWDEFLRHRAPAKKINQENNIPDNDTKDETKSKLLVNETDPGCDVAEDDPEKTARNRSPVNKTEGGNDIAEDGSGDDTRENIPGDKSDLETHDVAEKVPKDDT
ncbi:MAG: hypothetical protein Q9166_002115 [cf. Caloplaca sp. 2 TL-2023]